MSATAIKKLGFISRLAFAAAAAEALEASGIDPAAPDLSAAIATALKAQGQTDPALVAKGASYDKLLAQAAKAEMDLDAIAAKDDGLGEAIDARARALLAAGLGDNAPKTEEAAKTGAEKGKGGKLSVPAAAYAQAMEEGDEEAASAIFAANPDQVLARVNIVLPGEK